MNEGSITEDNPFTFNEHYFVVAVSDVHLGFDFFPNDFPDPAKTFWKFIKDLKESKTTINNFVILGDFLDLWRRDDDVFEDHLCILKSLVEMEENGKIKELHYLAGNHDYNIPWYKWYGYIIRNFSKKRRNLLKYFNFKKGSSKKPESLILPWKGKTFVFRHGHQDSVSKKWHLLYDVVCVLLGALGNETGWMASMIWKYKFYIPHFVTVVLSCLTILMVASSQWLLAGILGAAAFVFFLGMRWVMKTLGYKAMRALGDAEEVRQFMELKGEERKAKMDSIVRNIEDLFSMDEVLLVEEKPEGAEEAVIPYQKFRKLLQEKEPEVAEDEDVEEAEGPGTILIVGHTHELEKEIDRKYNLGAWVERKDCRILTIDRLGAVKMNTWPPYEAELQKRVTSSL